MIGAWIQGIITSRPGRVIGAAFGVALTIALLASLGIFLGDSVSSMTTRATRDVPVDWQVQLTSGADEPKVAKAIAQTRLITGAATVNYADIAGMFTTTGATTQATGTGKVVGLGTNYATVFPGMFRQLAGKPGGVELAQQTAANLHAGVGEQITIRKADGTSVVLKVDGVVTVHSADSFFQAIGNSSGAAPTAPPDNVVYLPLAKWRSLFSGTTAVGVRQVHVRLDVSRLPADPTAAYTFVTSLAKNLEARTVGAVHIGDNLSATLGSVRADALYAKVLFLFLGLPGALLSILITLSVVLTGSRHYALEQSLLRVRGASSRQVLSFEMLEAVGIGVMGIVLGAAFTTLATTLMGSNLKTLLTASNLIWIASAALAVFIVVVGTLVGSVRSKIALTTSESSKTTERSVAPPLWQIFYLDLILLAVGLFVYWQTAKKGYQVVLAPEGTPSVSVHYDSFIAPLCVLAGGALLGLRLFAALLGRKSTVRMLLRPVAARLKSAVASSMGRQKNFLARGVLMVGLAVAFAVSTSVFNTTYNAQSRVDAQLTNGADITVTGRPAAPAGSKLTEIRKIPGVKTAESMMHRPVYVGNDLQDLYGINPLTLGRATPVSDAYFANGNARATLSLLAKNPQGVLVSEETKKDYQLHVGDTLNLRLQTGADRHYRPVKFVFLGVVRKFPTAPKDSFIVANASYVSKQTGNDSREIVLIKSTDSPAIVSHAVRKVVADLPGVSVTDIASTQESINSNLTAVNLRGLSRLELVFAILAILGAAGLILALGLNERQRNFAVLEAIGASRRQLGAFVWSEVLLVLLFGTALGLAIGFSLSGMLVRILRGVFDPPPQHLALPATYLLLLLGAVGVSAVIGAVSATRHAHQSVIERIRQL